MRGLVTTSTSSPSSSLSLGVFLPLRHLLLLLHLLATFCTVGVHTTNLVEVEGVLGKEVKMPCRVQPDFKGGDVSLILWYKEGVGKPIYSYDARRETVRHRAEETVLGARANFLPREADPTLLIINLRENDEGIYRCRIDYKRSPTKRASVRLRVIIPPDTPSILLYESEDVVSGVVGPYEEGAMVSLICQVTGGRPSPNVTWYRDGQVLDNEIDVTASSVVRNLLTLPPLLRENLHDVLKCSASNTLDTVPVSTTVQIDMTFPPLSVNILSSRAKLSAGKTYDLSCRSVGSRPAARITWWLEGKQLKDATSEDSNGGNETHSTLKFTPHADNGSQELVCRAESPTLKADPLEDSWQLDILYKPMVELRYGQASNVDGVVEGSEFHFECLVMAQPPVQKITWFHKGILLRTNVSAGVVESNHTLVLQKVQRHQAGVYSCVAANDEGEGSSTALVLEVKYTPVCATDEVIMVGAARQETVSVLCQVEANPEQVAFTWTFNSSSEVIQLEEDLYNEGGRVSTLNYTVYNESDYGTILCWASNEIGDMAKPCKIRLIPAGPPDAPLNCTVTNQTTHTVDVACIAGYDGGLSQAFTVEVYDSASKKLAGNVTQEDLPIFTVQGLEAGRSFQLVVYSANAKRKSKEVALHGFTLPSPEPHLVTSTHIFPITPILGVLIGVIGALVIVAVVVVVVMRLRGDSNASRKIRPDAKRPTHKPLLPPKELEDNPDLIPSRAGDLGDCEILGGERIPPKLKHANLYETVTFGENKDSNAEQHPTEDNGDDEVEYAELTFNTSKTAKTSKFKLPKKKEKNANGAVRPHEDSTIYATIDHARTEAHATHPKDVSGEVPSSSGSRRAAGGNKKENGVCNGPVMADDGRTLDDIPLMDTALESSV